MKKQLFLFAFILCAFTSTQFVIAQNSAEIISVNEDLTAEKQAKAVIDLFGRNSPLTQSQEKEIRKLYSGLEEKMNGVSTIKDADQRQLKMNKLQDYVCQKLASILTGEQYDIYKKHILKKS